MNKKIKTFCGCCGQDVVLEKPKMKKEKQNLFVPENMLERLLDTNYNYSKRKGV